MPNESHSKFVKGLVDAFEDFALFCDKRWRAAIIAVAFLLIIGIMSLAFYYIYASISRMSEAVEKTTTTPADLQEGLVLSVYENQKIDLELTRIVSGENAGAAIFAKFHNSKTDLQGKHDFFYSGVNEILAPDNQTIYTPTMQSVPIVRLGAFMLPFLEKRCQSVFINQIENNDWMKKKLADESIDLLVACPIYDSSGKLLLGFTELVYEKGRKLPADIEHTMSDLETTSTKISNIISSKIQ